MAGKSLKNTKSLDNLKEAFAGESQANRRYLYFARVADIEGFPDIAGLFKDTADAKTGHAFGHLDFLKEVGDLGDRSGHRRAHGQDGAQSEGGRGGGDVRIHPDVSRHGQDCAR
jgi:rubrerythrin